MSKVKLHIEGMHCSTCEKTIREALKKVPGVDSCDVSFLKSEANVTGNEQTLQNEELIKAVKQAGYKAKFAEEHQHGEKEENRSLLWLVLLSILFTLPLIYAMTAHIFGFFNPFSPNIQWLLASIVQFLAGWQFYAATFSALKHKVANMDVLICLGTTAAYVYSVVMLFQGGHLYFDSSATIITLILIGRYFETLARQKASSSLKLLYQLQPEIAHIKKDSEWIDIPLSEVKIGDIFKVLPYEKIALDGVLIEGGSHVDESTLTGESRLISKKNGMKLFAATQNQEGMLIGKVTSTKTLFSQIIDLVEKTMQTKPQIQKFADRVSSIFVPATILISLATFAVWFSQTTFSKALMNAVSVLIIACPCALGLATPVVILIATTIGAKNKILFKNLEALQKIEKLDVIAIDKTGTITEGKPKLIEVIPTDFHTKEEIHSLAASLEEGSEHTIGKAIIDAFHGERTPLEDFRSLPGKGVHAKIAGADYYLGSLHFMKEMQLPLNNQFSKFQNQGHTVVALATKNKILGFFIIGDAIKVESHKGIDVLKNLDIQPILITGDDRKTAESVCKILGINTFYANVMPQGKAEIIKEWKSKGHIVGMVGDGVNDAVALSAADIGFAMSSGTNIALEIADITLLNNDILSVPYAITLAKKSLKKARMNIYFAFAYNVIAIPMAALGLLNPIIAAVAMGLSSLSVMINSLLLYKYDYGTEKFNTRRTV